MGLVPLCLALADDALVLGHRLSEWCGHAPVLEEELALANLGLDLIGQARALYEIAGAAEGAGRGEDDFAYFRDEREFRNLLLVELPRGDFAVTMVRQLFYAVYAEAYWRTVAVPELAGVAGKAAKEMAYHVRHAAGWVIRLGDGTAESHRRAQAAVDRLWPYVGEMFEGGNAGLRAGWDARVGSVLAEAGLTMPAATWSHTGGRAGRHTEHLGHLLAEMQHIARSHPGATW